MDTAIAIFAGFILDLLFGDPYWMPHPIRAMGVGIGLLEKKLRRPGQSPQAQFCSGLLLVCIMVLLSALVPAALLFLACRIHPAAGIVLESFMCYQILATKCLKTESMKVCKALREGDVEKARTAVSMIVGRDTAVLSEEGIIKAAVESGNSRLPIYRKTTDEIVGVLYVKDLLRLFDEPAALEGPVGRFARPVMFVPESRPAGQLLLDFRRERTMIAIVVDEYGGTAGLEAFGMECPEPDEDEEFDTPGGLIIDKLGRIPKEGEKAAVEWGGLRFEVLRAGERRIQRVLCTRLPEAAAPGKEKEKT